MTGRLFLAISLFAGCLLLWGFWQRPVAAPALNLGTIDGQRIDLADLGGKPVLVTFWSTSCPLCIAEMPYHQALYEQYCFGCHGLTGDGNEGADIPALNAKGEAWSRSRSELQVHILDGGETMPELSGLVSQDDAAAIIDFIQVWWTPDQLAVFEELNPQE